MPMSRPTPDSSSDSNGLPSSRPFSWYCGRNFPSASSRLKLYVACVRSLVPKLKNDASEATSSPAVRAALTTSIIVPNETLTLAPSARLRAATPSNMRLTKASSDALPTWGTITCGTARTPRRRRASAASNTAPICASYISGYVTPTRTPRWPIIGFTSASSRALAKCALAARPRGPAAARGPMLRRSASRSSGERRNSCNGGSSRRMVTLWPAIAPSIFSKSRRCMTASFLRCRLLSASDDAMIMSWNRPMRPSSLNMRSVRHRPMPRAPYSRACLAAAGVSALARTPSRLAAFAHPRIVQNSGVIVGSTTGRAPLYTKPSPPSIVIVSPSSMIPPFGSVHLAVA